MTEYQLTRYYHDRPETDFPPLFMHDDADAVDAASVSIAAEHAAGIVGDDVTYTLRRMDDAETVVETFDDSGNPTLPEDGRNPMADECEACGAEIYGPDEGTNEYLCNECADRFDSDNARSYGPAHEIDRIRSEVKRDA